MPSPLQGEGKGERHQKEFLHFLPLILTFPLWGRNLDTQPQ